MSLSDEAKRRLADVVALQPTKNATLAERWDLDGGKAVHQYLESELADYYFRDENSLIRATDEAAALVDVEPGMKTDEEGTVVRITPLQERILEVLPTERSAARSVVSVLHAVQDASDGGSDQVSVEDVRSGLSSLKRKGVVGVEYRSVPTYYRTESSDITLELADG